MKFSSKITTPDRFAIIPVAVASTCLAMVVQRNIDRPMLGGFDIFSAANYRRDGTDIMEYDSLNFARPGIAFDDLHLGIASALGMLWEYIAPTSTNNIGINSEAFRKKNSKSFLDTYLSSTWTRPVDILDARTRHELTFDGSGFTLFQDDSFLSVDWSNIESDSVFEQFETIVTPHILKAYPNATRFVFNPPIQRSQTSLKSINGPHLDFVPDDSVRAKFHADHEADPSRRLLPCLLGDCDTEEDELQFVLGLWIPTMATPVCDRPLAVVDASTIRPEDVSTVTVHLHWFRKTLSHVFALVQWNPEHRWYYYSYQKPNEMLAFHHYNRDKNSTKWGNPHTSFVVSDCGEDYETRTSAEFRVGVFFPKPMPK